MIEHDSSLSRNDIFFGDNYSFNRTIWDSVAAYFTEDIISIETGARARHARHAAARAVNPEFNITNPLVKTTGLKEVGALEVALFLRVFDDGTSKGAVTSWVNILFRKLTSDSSDNDSR